MLDPKDSLKPGLASYTEAARTCRTLSPDDLTGVVRVHMAAFPDSLLTAFGPEWVADYYRWHMLGTHAVVTLGVDCDGALAGFSVLLNRNGLKAFYRHYFLAIVWHILRSPGVILRGDLRRRVRICTRSFFQKSEASEGRPGTIRILSIAVHPAHQGNGFGQVLLRAAEEIAIARGASQLALTVHTDNTRAVRAYERAGWDKVLVDGAWLGAMRKDLEPLPETRK